MKNIKGEFDFLFNRFYKIEKDFIFDNWLLYINIITPVDNIELYINNLL